MDCAKTVVIGGGTAGCILAARLCRSGTAVHLFEVGPHPSALSTMRANMPLQRVLSHHNVVHHGAADPVLRLQHTTQQAGCANRRMPFSIGNVLGGRSMASAELAHIPPPHKEFDGWKIPKWNGVSLDAMLQELETTPEIGFERDCNQCMAFSDNAAFSPFTSPFIMGAVAENFLTSQSIAMHERSSGVVFSPKKRINPDNQSTISTFSQYVEAAQKHQFFGQLLQVQCDTRIESIRFDDQNNAQSVYYTDGAGIRQEVLCNRVIMCAGALESPRILLASGIGSPQEVSKFSTACRIPLNEVGKNLFDQLQVSIGHSSKKRMSSSLLFNPMIQKLIGAEWRLRGTGWGATSLEGPRIYGRGSKSDPLDIIPDYGVFLRPYLHDVSTENAHGCTFDARLLRPQSRGALSHELNEDGSIVQHVNPNYLSNPADTEMLREAIASANAVANTKPMQEVLREASKPEDFAADELAMEVAACGEFGGTCALGSVLTPELLVENTSNCYVCDASAVPTPMSAGLSTTVMVMAHKLANALSVESRYM